MWETWNMVIYVDMLTISKKLGHYLAILAAVFTDVVGQVRKGTTFPCMELFVEHRIRVDLHLEDGVLATSCRLTSVYLQSRRKMFSSNLIEETAGLEDTESFITLLFEIKINKRATRVYQLKI